MTEEIKMTDMEKTIPTLSNGYSLGTPEQAKKICDIWGVDYEPFALEVVIKLEKNFWKGMNQLRKDAIGELGVPSLLLGHYIYISLATKEMLKKTKPVGSLFSTFYINGKGSWSRKVGQELEYMILNIDEIKKAFKLLKNHNIECVLLVRNADQLGVARNTYFNQLVKSYKTEVHNKVDNPPENAKFFSAKYIVEAGKEYLSYAHWKKGLDKSNKVLDNDDYWKESEHFYIYEQN